MHTLAYAKPFPKGIYNNDRENQQKPTANMVRGDHQWWQLGFLDQAGLDLTCFRCKVDNTLNIIRK